MEADDPDVAAEGHVHWAVGHDEGFSIRDEGGVIVTMDEDENINPWSYQGRSVLVDEDDCKPFL